MPAIAGLQICLWGSYPRGYQVKGLWPRLRTGTYCGNGAVFRACDPALAHTNQIQACFGRPRGFLSRASAWAFALGRSARSPHWNRAVLPENLICIGRLARKYSASGPAFGVTITRATLWKNQVSDFWWGIQASSNPRPLIFQWLSVSPPAMASVAPGWLAKFFRLPTRKQSADTIVSNSAKKAWSRGCLRLTARHSR